MRFVKMHGAGNDFVLINNVEEKLAMDGLPELARSLCKRRQGVGADGMILTDVSVTADFRMIYFNSDGSEGEMCGNGARCAARFAYEESLVGENMRMETKAGEVRASRLAEDFYQISLPLPSKMEKMRLEMPDKSIEAFYVELGEPGVPHLCVALDAKAISSEELLRLGRTLRSHKDLPKGANVNFYHILSKTQTQVTTYERGVEDFTLACGTGSASVALTLWQMDPKSREEKMSLYVPGGVLVATSVWEEEEIRELSLAGEATKVFEGFTHVERM